MIKKAAVKKTLSDGGFYAAILAGGIGSRFWPLSRETAPKQVLKVVGDESLLRATIRRLEPLIPHERVNIVTSVAQAEIIRTHLAYDGAPALPGYIIEPFGRNTAPAIALAAFRILEKDADAIMAVLPADHIIGDGKSFAKTLMAARKAAEQGHLVTLGIAPTSPETGYGYIKAGVSKLKKINGFEIRPVDRFVEKPDLRRAKQYIKDGGYYWNSGIFVWKAKVILEKIEKHLPGIRAGLDALRRGASIVDAYKGMEAISIDHGVLEKAGDMVVIPAAFNWSDVGSWRSMSDVLPSDERGNVIRGRVVDIGSRNSIIFGCERLVAAIGLEDFIIVDTPDATLVCPKDRAEEVKDIVGLVKKKGFSEHEHHRTVNRPWGSYTLLEHGPGYKIKKICVLPGRRLSLQMHAHRSEHWVVITGTALVQRGEETVEIGVNQSTYIPRGVKHRLENPIDKPLEIIEVQNGAYVEEDDIVRFDDDFDRK
ncbi:MAG: mannose-1-phosphate guanylyltransferase/mannose-6-phosphate isomerase [Deltaproteobacteria bacterium]